MMPNSLDNNRGHGSESPPLLKRTRTLDHSFLNGPLRSAVRRLHSSPPNPNRNSLQNPNPNSPQSSDPIYPQNISPSFLDNPNSNPVVRDLDHSDSPFLARDWCYPSFPQPPKEPPLSSKPLKPKRVEEDENTILAVPELSKFPSKSPESNRHTLPDSNDKSGVAPKVAVKEKRQTFGKCSCSMMVNSKQVNSEPLALFLLKKIFVLRSLFMSLLLVSCILCISYAASMHVKVADLEEELSNLRRVCSKQETEILGSGQVGELHYGFPSGFGDLNSRKIALYTVLVTLVTPFLFFKYLDYLPRVYTTSKNGRCNGEEVPLKKRIAYRVDVCFSLYPYAKLLALLSATIVLIAFGGLALYAVSDGSLSEALWLSWTFVADSGNHAEMVGTGPRIVSVSISAGGMLIFAMMLGLVSDAISEKVDSLRKGKSEVIERNHILILGWSDKLGSLLKQLAIANQSLGGGVVVVLAERDKEEMEMDIAKLEFDFMGTSVICRSGSPLILADLKKVSVSKARAIIVLASDENADLSDARALRIVLSLTGVKEGLKGHVVVELSDLDNEPLVKLVGGEHIETVVAHDVIGRLMIQCALQPGLAQIWEDILGFENAEFYIKRWPQLDGMRFEEVLISFPDAVPCGVKVVANGGKIVLNPDDNYILKEGDEVLVIAEDDDTYAPGPLPEVRRGFHPNVSSPPKFPEKILFCGWRRDIDDMILVLEAFLSPGSELWMFNEVPEKERERKLTDGGLDLSGLENLTLVHREGNAVIRRHLESLPLETFDSMSHWRILLFIPILVH
ncbi:ion channel POLLUX isoform X2 [Amborella trichopoda]|uniref:ion channel POLLUX isoform X2 n=1 Tax=Amborella trichopoda TaxID=13333 RepID=UPI0009BD78B5|nr:ion channel POLLUX isoform X2 [Amborella trichopoda]|eukprot:XP_020524454.1 ion channel POLLUX isoform X2 [Amborella trichopoda]